MLKLLIQAGSPLFITAANLLISYGYPASLLANNIIQLHIEIPRWWNKFINFRGTPAGDQNLRYLSYGLAFFKVQRYAGFVTSAEDLLYEEKWQKKTPKADFLKGIGNLKKEWSILQKSSWTTRAGHSTLLYARVFNLFKDVYKYFTPFYVNLKTLLLEEWSLSNFFQTLWAGCKFIAQLQFRWLRLGKISSPLSLSEKSTRSTENFVIDTGALLLNLGYQLLLFLDGFSNTVKYSKEIKVRLKNIVGLLSRQRQLAKLKSLIANHYRNSALPDQNQKLSAYFGSQYHDSWLQAQINKIKELMISIGESASPNLDSQNESQYTQSDTQSEKLPPASITASTATPTSNMADSKSIFDQNKSNCSDNLNILIIQPEPTTNKIQSEAPSPHSPASIDSADPNPKPTSSASTARIEPEAQSPHSPASIGSAEPSPKPTSSAPTEFTVSKLAEEFWTLTVLMGHVASGISDMVNAVKDSRDDDFPRFVSLQTYTQIMNAPKQLKETTVTATCNIAAAGKTGLTKGLEIAMQEYRRKNSPQLG